MLLSTIVRWKLVYWEFKIARFLSDSNSPFLVKTTIPYFLYLVLLLEVRYCSAVAKSDQAFSFLLNP